MKYAMCFAALSLAISAVAAPAVEPTEQDAVAMVEKGAALIKAKGKAEMMNRIVARDKEFVKGELYIDMRDLYTGIVLAHPINPSIVGKNLTDIPDANGKNYRREIIELGQSKGKGWVEYQYKNPVSGKIEPKNTYILRVGDVLLEAGVYKN